MLRVILTTVLLFAIHVSEHFITYYIEFVLPPEQALSIYITLFGLTSLILSYFLARLAYDIGGVISTLLSEKPKYKQLIFFARVSFGAIAILVFLVTSLRLVSIRVSAVAGVAEWVASTLSGFTSVLIAMIVALQVKEIFGNYLAWMVLKFGDLIEAGDYISFGSEVLKVVRIGYSHTVLLNNLNEEIYVPNLRFLLE
ncbi:MAG: mechanosensitive ion channel, partial [Thermofilaceae archaeon]